MEQMNLESLKARVRRADYVVDPEAVAEAILRRFLGTPAEAGEAGSGGAGRHAGPGLGLGSGDVLEAG